MWKEILAQNFITITAIIFAFVMLIKNRTLDKRITYIFIVATIVFSVLLISDSLDYYFASFATLNNWRYVTSAIGYSLRPFALLVIIYIILRYNHKKYLKLAIAIPLIVNLLVCAFSPLTKWVFSFTEANAFLRGPIWFFPLAISGIYLAGIIVLTFVKAKYINVREIIIVIVISFSTVGAVLAEIYTNERFILNGVGVICVVFYYLYLLSQTFKRDSLTGLLNRHSFYSDSMSLNSNAYVFSIDMNGLKYVNDTFGHIAGDNALSSIADSIKETLKNKGRAYRIGGDEFVIILKIDNEISEVDEFVSTLKNRVNKKGFSIAIGYEKFENGMDFEKIYNKADKKMYLDKRKRSLQ